MKAKPKKRKVAVMQAYPKDCAFFLADDIRIEHDGKPSLLGMYPDNTVLFQLPQEIPDPSPSTPIHSPGLSILAHFPRARGTFDMTLELLGPNGQVIGKSVGDKLVGDRENINFVTRFSPFPVVGLGHYVMKITLGKKLYTFDFYIRRQNVQQTPSPVRLLPSTNLAKTKVGNKKSKK